MSKISVIGRAAISLLLSLVSVVVATAGTSRRVTVSVTDSVSGLPVPYAAIVIKDSGGGVLTDENGIAAVTLPAARCSIVAQTMGYRTKTVIVGQSTGVLTVALVPEGVALKEVVVGRGKNRYSKKNNPAVDFAESIRRARELTDPRRNDFYNYTKYERITSAINEFDLKPDDGSLSNKFQFLMEHVDTSEVSGKPVLTIAVSEKLSEVAYRREPRATREYVDGRRQIGVTDVMSNQESMMAAMEDVLREVDLYDDDITLMQNRFVSPLSRMAPDFYMFFLTDTVDVGGQRCVELSFVPHNQQSFGFTGRVYVPIDDPTMFVKRVEMRAPRDINLNFIENLRIVQDYERAADGSRLKVKDDMVVEVRVLPGAPGIYFRRNTAYSGHNFDTPARPELFDGDKTVVTADQAMNRDDDYWRARRLVPITRNEDRVDKMMERLRTVPIYYWSERALRLLISGYVKCGDRDQLLLGRLGDVMSGNSVEGFRLQAGYITTASLSRRWFSRGYLAYGFKDNRFKYMGELEYSFIDKRHHSREFPVRSIKLSHTYDVDEIGQGSSYYSNVDMILSSLTRMSNNQMTYRRHTDLEYQLELDNHFSLTAGLRHARQEATRLMPFVDGYGRAFWKYDQATVDLTLRYAPGEKFYQTKTERLPINFDAPVFTLRHTFGPMNVMGSRWTINKTEASVFKRVWLSAFGYVDMVVKGGHVWNQAPYPELLIPAANISYLIQPETFALLNPLEFITDTYGMWDLTYWANGALLNIVPGVKRLKLREVVSFRGYAGHLSMKNDPSFNANLYRFPEVSRTHRLGSTPYMEAAVGLDNILKIIRIDYVWRLSYRKAEGIDRSGVRATLHFTF